MLLYSDIKSSITNGRKELERFLLRIKDNTNIEDLHNVIDEFSHNALTEISEIEYLWDEKYDLENSLEEKNNDIHEMKENIEANIDLMFDDIENFLDDQTSIEILSVIINDTKNKIDECINRI